MTKLTDDEMLYMHRWADEHGCSITTKGEVGFGRPCVGVSHGNSYVDFLYMEMDYQQYSPLPEVRAFRLAQPTDAYHKHPCMAVLVQSDDWENIPEEAYDTALRQLYDWIKFCNENGWVVKISARKTLNKPGTFGADLELMMGGLENAELRHESWAY